MAARAQIGDDRRALADGVEVVDRERHAGLARHREEMQHAVGRAAGAGGRGDRVLERVARADVARPHVAAQQVHDELAGPVAFFLLRGSVAPGLALPDRREADELEHRRHRVGGELPAARARAGAGDVLDLQQFVVVDLAGRVRADRLEHVDDGQIAALRTCRGAIEPP